MGGTLARKRMAEDFERLGTTPEQQEELRPIYSQLLTEFNAIQAESAQKVANSFKRHWPLGSDATHPGATRRIPKAQPGTPQPSFAEVEPITNNQ